MTIQELLQSAFQAGVSHGQSFSGGTIDEMFHSDEQDFYVWLEENSAEINDAIAEKYQEGFDDGGFPLRSK